ncbi:hypothetical protein DSO57_1016840 [Entomophthora muscae]|uniref:Uncharacterized protein n=1 Tax=Entomophthora muscae TaxID=34485 RepID=A0ACC2UQK2_9FUNG|nr:hypothetical protein DSO57_1016840 [Entomophthora muscae]
MKSFFKIKKKAAIPAVKHKFLDGIKVKNSKGEHVLISDYWKRYTVVLKVVRRFGCLLCRYETRLLSELKPEFDALKVRFLAIGFEDVGLYDFLSGCFWDWEVLIDTEQAVHLALGLKRMPMSAGVKDLISSTTRAAILASNRAGIYGDFRGNGFQLGGTFIVEKGTSRLLYEHRQSSPGCYVSLKELYSCCGGNPDDIDEQAPPQCISYTVSQKNLSPYI